MNDYLMVVLVICYYLAVVLLVLQMWWEAGPAPSAMITLLVIRGEVLFLKSFNDPGKACNRRQEKITT